MAGFENVYGKLEKLFISVLPKYIEEVNKRHNDGIFIFPFENRSLCENCARVPGILFSSVNAKCTEKERIVESTVFEVCIAVKQKPRSENRLIEFWRYVEAIQDMLDENECDEWESCKVDKVSENDIFLRIEVNEIGK